MHMHERMHSFDQKRMTEHSQNCEAQIRQLELNVRSRPIFNKLDYLLK